MPLTTMSLKWWTIYFVGRFVKGACHGYLKSESRICHHFFFLSFCNHALDSSMSQKSSGSARTVAATQRAANAEELKTTKLTFRKYVENCAGKRPTFARHGDHKCVVKLCYAFQGDPRNCGRWFQKVRASQ